MKYFHYLFITVVVFHIAFCKEKAARAEAELVDELQSNKTVMVTGFVRQADGAPIAEARLSWSGSSTITNSGGYFKLTKIKTGRQVIEVHGKGFAPKYHVMIVRQKGNHTDIYLSSEQVRRNLKTSQNIKVKSSHLEIEIPAGSLVDSRGNLAPAVDLHFSHIDVRGKKIRTAPGRLVGVTKEGESVPLESFGMFDITARLNNKKLQVKKGSHVDVVVKLQVPTEDSEIPLWSLNEETGTWKQEGVGQVFAKGDQRFVRARLYHLSYYNFDKRFESTAIWLDSVAINQMSEAGLVKRVLKADYVYGRGVDYNGVASIQNIKDGKFCIQVKKGGTLALEARAYEGDLAFSGGKTIKAPITTTSCSFDDRQNALVVKELVLDRKVNMAEEKEELPPGSRGITLVQIHRKYGGLKIITLNTKEVLMGAVKERADALYVYTTEGRRRIEREDVLSLKDIPNTF